MDMIVEEMSMHGLVFKINTAQPTEEAINYIYENKQTTFIHMNKSISAISKCV